MYVAITVFYHRAGFLLPALWFSDINCERHQPMPYPWCVKPAGTADNVTTIIMGSGTAHTARPEDSVFPGQLRRKYANSELLYGE